MTKNEILVIDQAKNHSEKSFDQYMAEYTAMLRQGFTEIQWNNTLILYKPLNSTDMLFHTFNADTPYTYSKNMLLWMLTLKGYHRVITKLANPKLATLGKRYLKGYCMFTGRTWIFDLAKYRKEHQYINQIEVL